MANIFKLNKSLKNWTPLCTPESFKIEMFEGEKVFIHKIIFGSGLIESCHSVKKVSRS